MKDNNNNIVILKILLLSKEQQLRYPVSSTLETATAHALSLTDSLLTHTAINDTNLNTQPTNILDYFKYDQAYRISASKI